MSQGRAMSAIEALTNVAIGWLLALLTQEVAFPLVGVQAVLSQHLALSLVFTGASFLRSYAVRRVFTRLDAGC